MKPQTNGDKHNNLWLKFLVAIMTERTISFSTLSLPNKNKLFYYYIWIFFLKFSQLLLLLRIFHILVRLPASPKHMWMGFVIILQKFLGLRIAHVSRAKIDSYFCFQMLDMPIPNNFRHYRSCRGYDIIDICFMLDN